MSTIQVIKNLVLNAIAPLEARGILAITMRKKIVPAHITRDIAIHRKRSFCPFAHFDVAYRALKHIDDRGIEGDVVLCGVARGGLAKFMLTRLRPDRSIWLYDTFDGGSLPTEKDGELERKNGEYIKRVMATSAAVVQCYVDNGSGQCQWVIGDIMKTIPARMPEKIAFLYLDTDWYESTRHELVHLEPLVSQGGIIVQDDMGLCVGAAKAVEEYYGKHSPFIVPIDEAGCVWMKL